MHVYIYEMALPYTQPRKQATARPFRAETGLGQNYFSNKNYFNLSTKPRQNL